MALTDKERSREYRIRRDLGLDQSTITHKREIVLLSGVMSAAQYANPVERARILGELLDETLQHLARHAVTQEPGSESEPR